MFKSTPDEVAEAVKKESLTAEKNYVIQKNDFLKLEVFSARGERIVDPNPELMNNGTNSTLAIRQPVSYLVDINGKVRFPMVGEIKIEGLTLAEAEEILRKEYNVYFKDVFVILTYLNKRVIILGSTGGQVIPLVNQNITVVEVLALAKGIGNDGKAQNIRLIRNNHVYVINFSTIKGFKEGNMLVEPGDVVYVEHVRRPFSEALRDNYALASVIIGLASLIFIFKNSK